VGAPAFQDFLELSFYCVELLFTAKTYSLKCSNMANLKGAPPRNQYRQLISDTLDMMNARLCNKSGRTLGVHWLAELEQLEQTC